MSVKGPVVAVDRALPLGFGPPCESPSPVLRILIAATPKTGNTWLKLLLSKLYGLPVVSLPVSFSAQSWPPGGVRWVAHQHVEPTPALLDWAARNAVTVVTTLRHPGDVLVSLFYYAQWAASNSEMRRLADDGPEMGANVRDYVASRRFARQLVISAQWLKAGAVGIRYEDLLRDPLDSLEQLATNIAPTTAECIRCAVACCEIGVLRALKGREARHFRAGKQGQWIDVVPPAVLAVLRSDAYYQRILSQLGYVFDAEVAAASTPFDYSAISPFHGQRTFDNGVVVPAVVLELYFSSPAHLRRWPRPLETISPDSFFRWLAAPVNVDGTAASERPVLTNLAFYLHRVRSDLQVHFPEPLGCDRARFRDWVLRHGQREYVLPRVLLLPMMTAREAGG